MCPFRVGSLAGAPTLNHMAARAYVAAEKEAAEIFDEENPIG